MTTTLPTFFNFRSYNTTKSIDLQYECYHNNHYAHAALNFVFLLIPDISTYMLLNSFSQTSTDKLG